MIGMDLEFRRAFVREEHPGCNDRRSSRNSCFTSPAGRRRSGV